MPIPPLRPYGRPAQGRFNKPSAYPDRRGTFSGDNTGSQLRSRVLSAGELQLLILALLEEYPRHGYQIIKAIKARSNDCYSPSAGMVYPSLTALIEAGYATVESDGAKKLHSLTDTGRKHVEQNRERIASLFEALNSMGEAENIQPSQIPASDTPPPSVAATGTLAETFRDLKAILFDSVYTTPEEQSRVASILRRAITEIQER